MNIDEANGQYFSADSKAGQSAVKLADTFDDFLTLLTTQLANQDPLNPTDSTEFTNQLVSFTQVEQSIASNQNLEALIQLQTVAMQNNDSTTLISYLGHTIGSDLNLANLKDDQANWDMEFSAAADKIVYEIYDDRGNRVYSINDNSGVSKGLNTFSWDGTVNGGGQAPEGNYYLTAAATTNGGSIVDVDFKFKGVASSVETVNGAPVLMVNGVPVGLSNITSVEITDTTDAST